MRITNRAVSEGENGRGTDLAAHREFSGSRSCRPLKLTSATSCVSRGLDTALVLADSAAKRYVAVLRTMQDR
jgi:hypothetical protein